MPQRSLTDCLSSASAMGQLSAQAERLLKLQCIYERAVPAALARYGRVANIKSGKLVILAHNGAVAVKIRQLAPSLAEVFRQAGVDLSEIHVKVQPAPPDIAVKNIVSRPPLGETTKQGLTSLASELPPDSPLKGALKRLVERAAPGTTKR